jgi:nucleotide-binding universal stress UspA family protein
MPYRNLIVGTDGSATANRAVVQAAGLAIEHEARLVVVTAYEPHGDELVDKAGAPDELKWMLTDRSQAEELARSGKEAALAAGATKVSVQATESGRASCRERVPKQV